MEKLEKLQPALKLFFAADTWILLHEKKRKEQLLSQKTGKHSFVPENFI